MILNDGTGTGYQLKIDASNRAQTLATSQTRISDISKNKGQAYVISSGFISFTDADFSGLIYIKNTDTEERNMFIEHIRVCSTEAVTDPCHVKVKVIRNPTAGTLISNASAAYKANSNFGSANEFNGIAYKGANGNTVTDGDWFTQFINHAPGHSINDYNDSIVLPKNSAIAILVKPCDTMEVCCEVNVHFE
jgi:hypothetical protein